MNDDGERLSVTSDERVVEMLDAMRLTDGRTDDEMM